MNNKSKDRKYFAELFPEDENLRYSNLKYFFKNLCFLFTFIGAGALVYKNYSLSTPAPKTTYSKILQKKDLELFHNQNTGHSKALNQTRKKPHKYTSLTETKKFWKEVLKTSSNPSEPTFYEIWMDQLYLPQYYSIKNISSSEEFVENFLESCFSKDLIDEYKTYKQSHQFIFDYKRGTKPQYIFYYKHLKNTFYLTCYLEKIQEFYKNNSILNDENKKEKAIKIAYMEKYKGLINRKEKAFNKLFDILRDQIKQEPSIDVLEYLKENDYKTFETAYLNEIINLKFYFINELCEEAVISYNNKLSKKNNLESLALYSFSAALYCYFIFFLFSLIKEEN